jgi:Toastrack DUF4097
MRSDTLLHSLVVGLFFLSSGVCSAEVTRTLKAEVAAERISIENLAGTMRVMPSTGDSVVVVATIHAENQKLADGFRLDQSSEAGGMRIRVHYPLESGHRRIRYPDPRYRDDDWLDGFFSGSHVEYGGHRVRVSHSHGVLLYVDLEIEIPAQVAEAGFRNLVGLIKATGLRGKLRFDIASADAELDRLDGDIGVDGSSGDVKARDIRGIWSSNLSSGDVDLARFQGDSARFEASSGDIRIRGIGARRLSTETSSGDVRIVDADLEELETEASSGDVVVEERGNKLASVHSHASSGDVTLRLPRDSSFDARVDQTSGDLLLRFDDAEKIERGDHVIGARRGNGGVRIDVRTTSGDCTIAPL